MTLSASRRRNAFDVDSMPPSILRRRHAAHRTPNQTKPLTFPVIVLNSVSTTVFENRLFWYSFISTTWRQYSATCGRCRLSLRYTRLRMSFWKQDPPKPTDARRNLGPMRESKPTACATSSMFAPVASQIAESAFTDEMRCASIAFAASLESSEDQRPTVRMRSRLKGDKGRQHRYIDWASGPRNIQFALRHLSVGGSALDVDSPAARRRRSAARQGRRREADLTQGELLFSDVRRK